jgi:hypothetical protein
MQGALTTDLTIYDSGGGSPQLVTLAGTGTVVQLSRSAINFGSVPVGMSSKPGRVIVTNRGATKLNIGSINIVGLDSSDFSQVNACGSGLPPGQSCEIQVTFTPTTSGVRNATLGIIDGGGGSPQKVRLIGTGT